MSSGVSRRQVLLGGLATVAAVTAGLVVREVLDDEPEPSPPALPVTQSSAPSAALLSVGRQYLDDHPDEADVEVLRAHVGSEPADPSDLLQARQGEIRDDLAAGRTVDVAGWVLSETEARIAALAALS